MKITKFNRFTGISLGQDINSYSTEKKWPSIPSGENLNIIFHREKACTVLKRKPAVLAYRGAG